MVILQPFSGEINGTGTVDSSMLTLERDKIKWFTKTLQSLYSGGLGPNTLYLDSEPKTPVTFIGLKKSNESD